MLVAQVAAVAVAGPAGFAEVVDWVCSKIPILL